MGVLTITFNYFLITFQISYELHAVTKEYQRNLKYS